MEGLLVWFSVVHLSAMSSACLNPILYGFLNENFKQVKNNLLYIIVRVKLAVLSKMSNRTGEYLNTFHFPVCLI